MRRETPEPWATAMMEARATAPNGAPSITRLAEMAGISVETTRRVLYGMGDARVETINAIAAALRLDVRKVSEWAAQARSVAEPYKVPAEADLLTDKERRAITSLIRAITEGRRSNATQEPGPEARGKEPRGSRAQGAPISSAADIWDVQPGETPLKVVKRALRSALKIKIAEQELDALARAILMPPLEEPPTQPAGAEKSEPAPISGATDINSRRQRRPAPKPLPKAARTPRRGKKGESFDPESGEYVGGDDGSQSERGEPEGRV